MSSTVKIGSTSCLELQALMMADGFITEFMQCITWKILLIAPGLINFYVNL